MRNLYSHDFNDRVANTVIYTLGIFLVLIVLHLFLDQPKQKDTHASQVSTRSDQALLQNPTTYDVGRATGSR